MAQTDLKLMRVIDNRGLLLNGENLLKLNLDYDHETSKWSRKSIEINSMWKHEDLRNKAIKYLACGSTFKTYKCGNCGNHTIVHTNSCNLRICQRCCKKQYWRIKNRLWDLLEPYQFVRGKFKKFMLREITLTWEQDVQFTDLGSLIKERRKQINKLLAHYKRKGKILGSIKVFETKRSSNDPARIHVHAHILTISSYISQKELSVKWNKISGNPIVWIKLRRINQALNYLLKHIYKPPEILASDVPLFLKIFRNSRRITTDGILFGIKFFRNFTCDMAITCQFCGHDLDQFDIKSLFMITREFLNGVGGVG